MLMHGSSVNVYREISKKLGVSKEQAKSKTENSSSTASTADASTVSTSSESKATEPAAVKPGHEVPSPKNTEDLIAQFKKQMSNGFIPENK